MTPKGASFAKLDTSDPVAVAEVLRGIDPRGAAVLFENLGCPPFIPPTVIASLFEGVGNVVGACAALGLPAFHVAARTWQTALFGPPPKKVKPKGRRTVGSEGSQRKALFVEKANARWKGQRFVQADGRADAAWIAEWGRRFRFAPVAW